MYQGYRLKIEGNIVPETLIKRGSYGISDEDRIAETWKDQFKKKHIRTFGETKTIIQFSIREHDSLEHADIIVFFRSRNNLHVEFYNDSSDEYRQGVFRIEKIKFSHKTVSGRKIKYAETPITMEEY